MTLTGLWIGVAVVLVVWAGWITLVARRMPRAPSPDAWVPIIAAGMLLGESLSLVNRRIANGQLRSRMYSGETYIRRRDIQRALDGRLFDWKQRGRVR